VEIDTFWKAGYNTLNCTAHTEKQPSTVLTRPEHSFRNFFQHLLRYNVGSYQSKSCARSSVDRALVFGTRCRGFESLRAYCFCLSLLLLLPPRFISRKAEYGLSFYFCVTFGRVDSYSYHGIWPEAVLPVGV
jgi:hypothetical protein